jgi:hypothetical protein
LGVILKAVAVPLIASAAAAQAQPESPRIFISPIDGGRLSHRQLTAQLSPEHRGPRSPFFASFAVAPNATIGVGRFNCLPRRRLSTQDQPVTLERKATRRAAVGLALRF